MLGLFPEISSYKLELEKSAGELACQHTTVGERLCDVGSGGHAGLSGDTCDNNSRGHSKDLEGRGHVCSSLKLFLPDALHLVGSQFKIYCSLTAGPDWDQSSSFGLMHSIVQLANQGQPTLAENDGVWNLSVPGLEPWPSG